MLLFVTRVSKARYGKRFPGTEFCLFSFSMIFFFSFFFFIFIYFLFLCLFGWRESQRAVWVAGRRSVNSFLSEICFYRVVFG